MPHPPAETCSECGKPIGGKTQAHVWEGQRVVCFRCLKNLELARLEANPPRHPATEQQLAYARELGLAFLPGVSSQEISDLIREAENPPAGPELIAKARALGIEPGEALRTKSLEAHIREAEEAAADSLQVLRWVYSVCRHMSRAKWILPSDVPVHPTVFYEIAAAIAADEKLRQGVLDQGTGTPPHWFDNAVDDRGIDYAGGAEDHWYFFGKGGPSTRSKAYTATKSMIQARLWPDGPPRT